MSKGETVIVFLLIGAFLTFALGLATAMKRDQDTKNKACIHIAKFIDLNNSDNLLAYKTVCP